jgi:DNA-binding NtrC family response regulator
MALAWVFFLPSPLGFMPNPVSQILIIARQPAIRQTLRQTLQYYGYDVLEGTDARDGLRAFQKDKLHIGLVILDLAPSDIPGEKVLAALRTLDPKVRVAVCTSHSGSELKGQSAFAGVIGILRKPINTDRLLAVVKKGLFS